MIKLIIALCTRYVIQARCEFKCEINYFCSKCRIKNIPHVAGNAMIGCCYTHSTKGWVFSLSLIDCTVCLLQVF